jgi:hypothetical protein
MIYTIRAHVDGLPIHQAQAEVSEEYPLKAFFQVAKDVIAQAYGFAAEGITVDAFDESGAVAMSYTFASFNDETGL